MKKLTEDHRITSSFRDPSGFVFEVNGTIYRQVNTSYKFNYENLMSSGLYDELSNKGFLISHTETNEVKLQTPAGYKLLKPTLIPFISYPYEWCFDQLKDAALLTLKIQMVALRYGMVLKDSSAYNVQFLNGKPIFIDTLSFEKYNDGEPWIAYKQFCEHFFGPLCLMHYTDIRLYQLLKCYIDGIPLNLTSKLLTFKSKFSFSVIAHIHSHALSQNYHTTKATQPKAFLPLKGLKDLIRNLRSGTSGLKLKTQETEWDTYYAATNYTSESELRKKALVSAYIKKANVKSVWDIGSNNGLYSRLASDTSVFTVSLDIDEIAVNSNYLMAKSRGETNILPLILNITNPSAGLGWGNEERLSLKQRGPVDLIMALALVHHLAISNNTPLIEIAKYFSGLCHWLIIEFIPKTDSQVLKLLAYRQDIFSEYYIENFESDFKYYFDIISKEHISESERTLYLLKVHDNPRN